MIVKVPVQGTDKSIGFFDCHKLNCLLVHKNDII